MGAGLIDMDVIWRELPPGEWAATAGKWELDVTKFGHRFTVSLAYHDADLHVEITRWQMETAEAGRQEAERLLEIVASLEWKRV